MDALRSQEVAIDARESDYLILYRSANRTKALELAQKLRGEKKAARLMRKDADTPLREYKEYGKRNEVGSILYIDDTGETTEFDLTEEGEETGGWT